MSVAPLVGDVELDVLQDRLGAAGGAMAATVWNACSSFSRLQVIFIARTFCFEAASMRVGSASLDGECETGFEMINSYV